MINIRNNLISFMVNGARIQQTHHNKTGKPFQSEEECFDWLVSSGWFERCKADAIRKLKEQAQTIIHKHIPPFKQVNAALGLYAKHELKEMTAFIQEVRNAVDKKEQAIINSKTLKEFLNLIKTRFEVTKK